MTKVTTFELSQRADRTDAMLAKILAAIGGNGVDDKPAPTEVVKPAPADSIESVIDRLDAMLAKRANTAVNAEVRNLASEPTNIVQRGNGRKAVIVDVDDDGNAAAAGDNIYDANPTSEGWRFPATFKDAHGKLKSYKCNPNDRKAFMETTRDTTFGMALSLSTFDKQGNEKTVDFPAVATLTGKQFSSGNHGIYGRVDSVRVVLANGDEYILSGQVNLQLQKRVRIRK